MTGVRALVTGATGQDGSYLVDRLLAEAAEVHVLQREQDRPPGSEGGLPGAVHGHVGDLGDAGGLAALVAGVEPTEVYNLGGLSSVALSWQEPALTGRISGLAVGHLLEAALALQERTGRPVRLVQASSAEIFGAAATVPQDETTAVAPVTPYGAAKAYAHHLVGVYRARGVHATSCILYNHESPRRPTTFVTRKITQGAARIAAGVEDHLSLGNLDARRDWGWAPDYVDAMVRAVRADRAQDFVVATGVSHSVREFVAAAFVAAGVPDWQRYVRVDERFTRPSDAPELVGDAGRARRELGWQPTVPFDEVVRRMVQEDQRLVAAAG